MTVPTRIYGFLIIGLVAVSQSGNIIRIGDAHPVAIAAWRLALATLLFAPFALGQRHHLRRLAGRDRLLLLLSSAFLALHFFAWIAAVQNTTVAKAAIFLALTPVFTASGARVIYGEPVGRKLILAIAVGVGGIVTIGLDDLTVKPAHLVGDVLSVICALLFAAYLLIGRRLNRLLPTPVAVFSLYGIAAVISFAVLLTLQLPVADYDGRTWLCFLLMALVPTGLGHTSFNAALRYIRAGWVSATTLVEPLLAGLVACWAWGEALTLRVSVGYLLICIAVLILAADRSASPRAGGTGSGHGQ